MNCFWVALLGYFVVCALIGFAYVAWLFSQLDDEDS